MKKNDAGRIESQRRFQHLTRKNLHMVERMPMIGGLNRVYEVLNGTRMLTMPMARKLHVQLKIPAECLLA